MESDGSFGEAMSVELWRSMIQWVEEYPNNSIYHALFYKLFFSVLRQGRLKVCRVMSCVCRA